jgi:hypothetical protein
VTSPGDLEDKSPLLEDLDVTAAVRGVGVPNGLPLWRCSWWYQ